MDLEDVVSIGSIIVFCINPEPPEFGTCSLFVIPRYR